ncbi:MAG: translation factor GTPase family protein, partial [Lachnoclostridium sp.]|nr:translation factor GTPase family protein [Lachnoclostridium sp.]
TFELERSRGITIFSKQAEFRLGEMRATLLDTPGHVDFSAEMERTLQVLDYAILVVSGADGVQGHTRTLWNLLKKYRIPVFLFINKMDQNGTDRNTLMVEMKKRLDESCILFDDSEEFLENVSVCDETALEEYLEQGRPGDDTIRRMIGERRVFPCYFGSALKLDGVKELLDGLKKYAQPGRALKNDAENGFGAKVYKISRDDQGNRLTHLRVTSGILHVKDSLSGETKCGESWEEKVNQIWVYSGEKYELLQEAEAGSICAVTGLSKTCPGEGLGREKMSDKPVLEPVLNYQIMLPKDCDVHTALRNLKQLEEEDPMLRIVWNEELEEIHARLMGEVQTEILKSVIRERFGIEVEFGTGNIVYKETIGKTVEGVGHFEPLRHYAEVHLILEPTKRGSGLEICSDCSEDILDKNWQRLILTHLAEKVHRGVLTGSAVTDMKITLAAGKAHLKHTEGGDFRQATYRAVRQGLMQAESVLLEPYYEYRLEVPAEMVGRALTDIQRMSGTFEPPETDGEIAVISGSAPVAAMRDYQMEVIGYTKGRGRLSCIFKGYEPCHNPEEVIEEIGYDPERDLDNPAGSVFCAHGAGFNVPWNQVPDYMHLENQLKKREAEARAREEARRQEEALKAGNMTGKKENIRGRTGTGRTDFRPSWNAKEEKELEEIFIRTYGKIERKTGNSLKTVSADNNRKKQKKEEVIEEYLLVDGYNIIFAWDDLKELAKENIEAARNKLMDILCNYQGFKKCAVILVFDAYKVEGCAMEIQKYHNIHVVYTKEAETADQYIEKVVHQIGRKYHVTVATSDGVEQVVTLGQGGKLISAREFREEVEIVRRQIQEEWESHRESGRNYLFDHMDDAMREEMNEVRLGRKELK